MILNRTEEAEVKGIARIAGLEDPIVLALDDDTCDLDELAHLGIGEYTQQAEIQLTHEVVDCVGAFPELFLNVLVETEAFLLAEGCLALRHDVLLHNEVDVTCLQIVLLEDRGLLFFELALLLFRTTCVLFVTAHAVGSDASIATGAARQIGILRRIEFLLLTIAAAFGITLGSAIGIIVPASVLTASLLLTFVMGRAELLRVISGSVGRGLLTVIRLLAVIRLLLVVLLLLLLLTAVLLLTILAWVLVTV